MPPITNVLLFLLFVRYVESSQYKMVITFGIPQTPKNPHISNYGWETCIDNCYESRDCLFVTKNATTTCTFYQWDDATPVLKTDRASGSYVAFKIHDDEEGFCPAESVAPVVSGAPANSSVQTGSPRYYLPYSIIFSDGFWTIKTPECPPGYHYSQRKAGPWCILVAVSTTHIKNPAALALCRSNSSEGVLSGIESVEEYNYILGVIRTQNKQRKPFVSVPFISYWIGGQRKPECMKLTEKNETCNGTNEFTIDDPTWQFPGYYPWFQREPNGATGSANENCIVIRTSVSDEGLNDIPQNSQSFYKMIVTWGTPQSFTTYSSLSLDWEDCLNYCLNSTNCIVVSNQTASKCLLFGLGQISTVNQTNTGVIVGFKVRSNETSCPITDDAPIVGGSPGTVTSFDASQFGPLFQGGIPDSSNTRNQTYQPYTVTSSAGLWTIVQEKKQYCGIAGNIFDRPLGPWCIWIMNSIGCVDQATAANKCNSSPFFPGAVLSGIQSVGEYNTITSTAKSSISDAKTLTKYTTVAFWIGGTRRTECMAPNTDRSYCNGSNEFSFSDPTFSYPGYYGWLPGQPSGITTNPTTANCLNLRVTASSIGVDDDVCSTSLVAQKHCQWGVVCGKKPT